MTEFDLNANYLQVRFTRTNLPSKPTRENAANTTIDAFVAQFRSRGVRVTMQRLAVFRTLALDGKHPTADSLYAKLRQSMPSLSLSTVYRILDSLEDQGLIRQVSTTNGAARYDANLHPHQHLVCRRCGTMTDLEDESLAKISLPEVRIHHFIAEELDIRIVGTCVQCSSRARQKNQTGDPRSPAFKEEKPWRS